jgi:short-subunit dehydrogenase
VVSSLQGKTGFPGSSAYCASKHALHGLFDSLRCELDGSGVSVTIVCPGAVDTPIHGTKEKRVRKDAVMMSANECAAVILRAAKQRSNGPTRDRAILRVAAPPWLDGEAAPRAEGWAGRARVWL